MCTGNYFTLAFLYHNAPAKKGKLNYILWFKMPIKPFVHCLAVGNGWARIGQASTVLVKGFLIGKNSN
jgi:hypothetical protein